MFRLYVRSPSHNSSVNEEHNYFLLHFWVDVHPFDFKEATWLLFLLAREVTKHGSMDINKKFASITEALGTCAS